MKSRTTLVTSIIATSLITALVFSYLANKTTIKVLVEKFREVEVFNEVGRVKTWGNIEELLEKGCIKEALLYVKNEKATALSAIKNQAGDNLELIRVSEQQKTYILNIMKNNKHSGFFQIPSCK